jgi:hypothetical protein
VRDYQVTTAGFASPSIQGVEFIRIPQIPKPLPEKLFAAMLLKLGQFERYYWMDRKVRFALEALGHRRFDLIVANDVATLPLALRLAKGASTVLDAHEYAPREFEEQWRFRFFLMRYADYLCRSYLSMTAGMSTVSDGIAKEYARQYGVLPKVIPNVPEYRHLDPAPVRFDAIRMVHHGAAVPGRRLESMIDLMRLLDKRFLLDFYLISSDPAYLIRLKERAANDPRIRFLAPIDTDSLPETLNQYDIGLYILQPSSFNNAHALPNKFFEFVQARLATAIGPSPEMQRLARRYGFGIVAQDFTPGALAREMNALTVERLAALKANAHEAARELCFERFADTFLSLIEEAMGSASCAA